VAEEFINMSFSSGIPQLFTPKVIDKAAGKVFMHKEDMFKLYYTFNDIT